MYEFNEISIYLFQSGDTPLDLAVKRQYFDVIELLLERTDIDLNKEKVGNVVISRIVKFIHTVLDNQTL